MIEFGKSYYYAKENKIVFPMIIEDERIICSDRSGNTIVVLSSADLSPSAKAPKKVVVPNYSAPKVVAPVAPEVKVEKPVEEAKPINVINVITKSEEPELIVITKPIEVQTPVVVKRKKKAKVIVEESDYI